MVKKSTKKTPVKKTSVRRKVQKIVDGDSFTVRKRVAGSQHIRIANLNAPEKDEKGYKKAKEKLARQIRGKTVALKIKGKSYGRTVAETISNRKKIQDPKKKSKKKKT